MGRALKKNDPPAAIGEVIGGRFQIEAELGEGGMATVYRALDLATKRPFALKLLKPEIADSEEAMARLQRECEVLQRLDNPAVVQLETFGKLPDGRIFMVMELLEGETLGDRMRRDKRLDPDDLAPIVAGAVAGLTAAHKGGVVHRDLKPDNIFLAKTGPDATHPNALQVKLLDFGISKVYSNEERLTRTGQVLGTPRYMAPEQLSAEPDLDARVDVYALGVIMYEALAGSPPFIASSPSDLIIAILNGRATGLRTMRPDLPAELESVVQRAMARSRDARFATPHELADAYFSVLGSGKKQRKAPAGTRHGMRTHVLGSAAASVPPPAEEDLRPGTFSDLEKGADVPAAAAAPVAAPPPADLAAVSAGPTAAGTPASIRTQAEPSEPIVLPTSAGGGKLWIVVALLAGAITAGAAIWWLQRTEEEPPAPSASSAVTPEALGALSPPEGEERAETDPHADLPVAPHPESVELPEEAEVDSEATAGSSEGTRRRRRRRDRTQPTTPTSAMADPGDEPPNPFVVDTSGMSSPMADVVPTWNGAAMESAMEAPRRPTAEIVREATAALRAGDGNGCLRILGELPRSRPAYALRLEGDCHLRAGNRRDAVKAYEQICERYPNGAGIDQIRSLVSSLGGHCPAP